MKIKIPPYPNYDLTQEAFERDIATNSEVRKSAVDLESNKLFFIAEFKSGIRKIYRTRSVKYNGNFYISPFPNPIHLFFSLGVEHYHRSEEILSTNFPKCGKKLGADIYLLDIDEDETHECYNHYIKYRASSIIMLVSSLEAFLNHIIPNDFIYLTKRKDKIVHLDKTEIESTKVTFREKLLNVIPQWLGLPTFWDDLKSEKNSLLELYENRKNIVHLKTNAKEDFERYFEALDKMIDLDLQISVDSLITFMNTISEKFVEFR